MVEATDRPQEGLPGPAWPGEGVTLTPAAPPPPAETYQPLSGLALTAFLLALLYAVAVTLGGLVAFAGHHPWWLLILAVLAPPAGLVAAAVAGVRGAGRLLGWAGLSLLGLLTLLGVGGLVAYSSSNPWLLPGWTILLPLVAGVLAWLARGRIRDSEGTLGGATLAGWGLGLSLFFGLTYVAYYAGAYVAVRQQAESFSRRWIELIAQGKLPEAFVLTIPARDRPAEPTREMLELRTMAAPASPLGPSGYAQFCQMDYVRALERGGPGTVIRPLGVVEWTYKSGRPQVMSRYHVDTDVAGFDILVTALGSDNRPGEGGARQWDVVLQSSGRPRDTELTLTPKGERMMQSFNHAGQIASTWLSLVGRHAWDQAYLDTLPPDQRDRAHQAREACDPAFAAAAGLGALAGQPAARDYLVGRAALFGGDLVRADPSAFWAPNEKLRKEAPERVRAAFRLAGPAQANFEVRISRMPLWERDGDRFRFLCDSQVTLPPTAPGAPSYVVEGQLEVEGEAAPDAFPTPGAWRVRRLDLLRARTGSTMARDMLPRAMRR
jgi:hypothetical protein